MAKTPYDNFKSVSALVGAMGEWGLWLASRPEHVRRVAEQFPPGTSTVVDGRTLWLLSYAETKTDKVMLRFSEVNPAEDYDAALRSEPIYVCAEHFTASAPSASTGSRARP